LSAFVSGFEIEVPDALLVKMYRQEFMKKTKG
jgi:hypothetical protein